MTKSQSKQAFNSASKQQGTASDNAQSSYTSAVGDIGDYKASLADYAAKNPYVQGGQFQTATNQQLADTAAGGAKAGEQAITGAMVRSGLNPAGAIAAGKQVSQENSRNLMDAEAKANEARLQGLTGYNTTVLGASAKPEEMEADLMKSQLGSEQGALGAETDAAKTPSFWQELGQGAINGGVAFAGGMGAKACWIAAHVFGGWERSSTILVRHWLLLKFARTWYGYPLILLYMMFGEWVADKLMPRSKIATSFFRWLFNQALERAELWLVTVPGNRAVAARLAEVL